MAKPKYKLKDILVENSKYKSRDSLKKRLLNSGLLQYMCSLCGLGSTWNNQKLVLQLDHTNGVSNDNRLENLRILCPNCHTQTKTYAGKNNKTAKLIQHICPVCSVAFTRLDSKQKSRGYPIAYCSKKCSSKPNGLRGLNSRYGEERLPEFTELECIYCSKTFKRRTAQENFKSKTRKSGPFCSSPCVSYYHSEKKK